MARRIQRRTVVTTLSILAVLLVAIGTVALIKALGPGKQDPYVQQESSQTETPNEQDETKQAPEKALTPEQKPEAAPSTIDPSTVNTLTISPMEITVSYVKGIGAFEYEVSRASNGTRYVEFSSTKLVGTKCTNDKGVFASIIANPTAEEQATLSSTTTIEGTTYGLSLAGVSCTASVEELQKYQKSFSDAFTLLKKSD